MHSEHPFSWPALMRIVAMGIIVLLAWKALAIFPVILIAFVLAASFYPIVLLLQKKTRMPYVLAILLVVLIPLIPILFLCITIIPQMISQLPALFGSLHNVFGQATFLPESLRNFNLLAYLQGHFDASTTVNIALTIFSVITTIVLTFFLLYDFERLLELFLHIIPSKEKGRVKDLMKEIAVVTGKYIRGNVFISLICGVVVFVGLSLLHVPYALPLAVFAAVLDLLPLVGQTIGAIPAVLIGFSVSPLTGLFVIILHLLYQQAENAIISPVIYNKALNLFPAVSFLAVIIGGSLFGILGAFLALPVAASVPAILNYRRKYNENVRHTGVSLADKEASHA